MLPHFQTIH